MPSLIDRVMAVQRGEAPLPPVAKLIGLRLTDVQEGRVTMQLDADERHANPMGTLHGGILCDLGDAAMGTAFATTLREGETYATIELKCSFLRPVWKARLTATARVIHRGKTVGAAECDVRDERDRLVARLSSTLMVLTGDAAKGR